jgi:periplasmic divalent cation tolerance protein
VREEREVLLIAKSTAARVGEIEAWLRGAHPYDVPECVSLAPASVEARYLAWMLDETAGA